MQSACRGVFARDFTLGPMQKMQKLVDHLEVDKTAERLLFGPVSRIEIFVDYLFYEDMVDTFLRYDHRPKQACFGGCEGLKVVDKNKWIEYRPRGWAVGCGLLVAKGFENGFSPHLHSQVKW